MKSNLNEQLIESRFNDAMMRESITGDLGGINTNDLIQAAKMFQRQRNYLQRQLDSWERTMSEALNSGDGTYRP
jgi:hypothetical protein